MYMNLSEDKYKRVKITEGIVATGYKSMRIGYTSMRMTDNKKVRDEGGSLTIATNLHGFDADFSLTINDRTALLKLKEAIEFAIGTDGEDADKPNATD